MRLTAGLAISATLLHVAMLSLHVAIIATLALSGDANASERSAQIVICTPAPRLGIASAVSATTDNAPANNPETASATFCPVCSSGTGIAWVQPETPQLPILLDPGNQQKASYSPGIGIFRHEAMRKQIRGPPRRI